MMMEKTYAIFAINIYIIIFKKITTMTEALCEQRLIYEVT